jgi:hypothetical protein
MTVRVMVCLNLLLLILSMQVVEMVGGAGTNNDPDRLRVAFCLTGQLARLEIISKIKHIFVPNALLGHQITVFTMVDGNVSNVQQTLYQYDYSANPYAKYNETGLNQFLISTTAAYYRSGTNSNINAITNPIVYRTKYLSPPKRAYPVQGDKVPVANKMVSGIAGMESAATRFQKNMRWMSAVRDCVKWVQEVEFRQRWFFDAIVRLRDDSYALNTWLLQPASRYRNGIVSVNFGLHHGINDHNFVVARRYADVLLRGMTEDYYFNDTLDGYTWLNPEHRIAKVAESVGMPVHVNTLCMQPLLPLRGLETNMTGLSPKILKQLPSKSADTQYWRLHPAYVNMAVDQCSSGEQQKLKQLAAELGKLGLLIDKSDNARAVLEANCCEKPWMQAINVGYVPLVPI